MEKKILIAEDHAFVRWSVRDICQRQGFTNLDEVQTCKELMDALRKNRYSHLILDLTLADGDTHPLLKDIFEGYPGLKVLVSSAEPAHLYQQSLYLRYGFLYLSKAAQGLQTMETMISFLNNKRPPELNFHHTGKTPFSELSLREKQVVRWLVRNWSPAEIGEKLRISPATVRVQKKIILEKTGTKNIQELKKLANLHQV